MKMTRRFGFMKLYLALMSFVMDDNRQILLLSIYITKTLVNINPTGESDKNHEDEDKYLIEEVLEKFNKTLSILTIRNK